MPRIFREAAGDAPGLLDWSELERAMNNFPWLPPNCIETIGKRGNKRTTPVLSEGQWLFNSVPDGKRIFERIQRGDTFVLINASRMSERIDALCREIEGCHGGSADVHVYAGLKSTSRSFPIHWDRPDNFIVPVSGVSRWKLYSNTEDEFDGACLTGDADLDCVADELVRPGDLIYIPARTYHYCVPTGKRMSLSIPLVRSSRPAFRRKWYRLE